MAVPSVANVNPASGPPTGGTFVQILGGNFRLPSPPPATGPVPKPPPTVEVLVDGVPGTNVIVVNHARLMFLTPKGSLLTASGPVNTRAVDVVVRNIDDNGDVIAGETYTVADGFTYTRPDVSSETVSDFTRLVKEVVRLLKSEVLPDVVANVHTDYSASPDSTRITKVASVPHVVLTGPETTEDRFFTANVDGVTQVGSTEYRTHRIPRVLDLQFTLTVVDTSTSRILNILSLLTTFFDRNKFIALDGIQYELDVVREEDFSLIKQTNDLMDSNLRTVRGSFAIKGFPVTGFSGFTDDGVVDAGGVVLEDPSLETQATLLDDVPDVHGASTRSPGEGQQP